MRILVIGNPVAGGGTARARIQELAGLLEERGHAVEVFLTGAAGDAGRRAGGVEDGVERLVVVGGDGTLNEVLNGLQDPSRHPLVQLPTGTANILARELGLPFDVPGVARLVDAGEVRRVDMGLAGERRFLMVASSGFDAMVTDHLRRSRKGTLGFHGYLRPVLEVLRSYRPPELRVTVDDGPSVRCEFVIVSNTRNYGGLFTIADRARYDDGELDVCMFSRASILSIGKIMLQGLTGGVSGRGGVEYRTGTRIRIDAATPAPVEVDGDYFGETPVELRVEARHVPFLAPARGAGQTR